MFYSHFAVFFAAFLTVALLCAVLSCSRLFSFSSSVKHLVSICGINTFYDCHLLCIKLWPCEQKIEDTIHWGCIENHCAFESMKGVSESNREASEASRLLPTSSQDNTHYKRYFPHFLETSGQAIRVAQFIPPEGTTKTLWYQRTRE